MDVTIQLIVDAEIANLFQWGSTCGTAETFRMQKFVVDANHQSPASCEKISSIFCEWLVYKISRSHSLQMFFCGAFAWATGVPDGASTCLITLSCDLLRWSGEADRPWDLKFIIILHLGDYEPCDFLFSSSCTIWYTAESLLIGASGLMKLILKKQKNLELLIQLIVEERTQWLQWPTLDCVHSVSPRCSSPSRDWLASCTACEPARLDCSARWMLWLCCCGHFRLGGKSNDIHV